MIAHWIVLCLLQAPAEPAAQEQATEQAPEVVPEVTPEPTPVPIPEPIPEAAPKGIPSAADEATSYGPVSEWHPLSSVDLIINEECITSTDFRQALLRNDRPISSEADRARQLQGIATALISRQLKTQAGRDMGFDPSMIERYVADSVFRRKKAAGSASRLAEQLKGSDLDAVSYHEDIESGVLRELWTGAVVGQFPGVGGRTFRDRYVRPRRLKFEFERQEGRLDLPSTVTVQQMLCDPVRTGSLASARQLADRLRQEVLDGGDFGELAVENGAAPGDTMGLHKELDEERLALLDGMQEFLDAAEPGDISEVLPVRQDGELQGWRVMKLVARNGASVAQFGDAEVQKVLRKRYVEVGDKAREEEALSELFEAAYVWPAQFFGREEDPVQGPPTKDGEGPQSGT